MVRITKDSQGRYVVTHKRKYGIGKGKTIKNLHFTSHDAIEQAGAIVSIEMKRQLRRQLAQKYKTRR